jgi:hypothetical protein
MTQTLTKLIKSAGVKHYLLVAGATLAILAPSQTTPSCNYRFSKLRTK